MRISATTMTMHGNYNGARELLSELHSMRVYRGISIHQVDGQMACEKLSGCFWYTNGGSPLCVSREERVSLDTVLGFGASVCTRETQKGPEGCEETTVDNPPTATTPSVVQRWTWMRLIGRLFGILGKFF